MENKSVECCPEFNSELWDGKVFEWNDKKFIKDRVLTFFYIPINFGSVMKRLDELDINKWYMWYTTCTKCAKKYGKNYVAIIGRH